VIGNGPMRNISQQIVKLDYHRGVAVTVTHVVDADRPATRIAASADDVPEIAAGRERAAW